MKTKKELSAMPVSLNDKDMEQVSGGSTPDNNQVVLQSTQRNTIKPNEDLSITPSPSPIGPTSDNNTQPNEINPRDSL